MEEQNKKNYQEFIDAEIAKLEKEYQDKKTKLVKELSFKKTFVDAGVRPPKYTSFNSSFGYWSTYECKDITEAIEILNGIESNIGIIDAVIEKNGSVGLRAINRASGNGTLTHLKSKLVLYFENSVYSQKAKIIVHTEDGRINIELPLSTYSKYQNTGYTRNTERKYGEDIDRPIKLLYTPLPCVNYFGGDKMYYSTNTDEAKLLEDIIFMRKDNETNSE